MTISAGLFRLWPLVIAAVVAGGEVGAQIRVVPPTITVTPMGVTPVTLVPGGSYVIHVAPTLPPATLRGLLPGVSVTDLPGDPASGAEVHVAPDAPPGAGEVEVASRAVPVIVVPPPPSRKEPAKADSGEPDDSVSKKAADVGSAWWRWALVFGLGLGLGALLRRRA